MKSVPYKVLKNIFCTGARGRVKATRKNIKAFGREYNKFINVTGPQASGRPL